MKRPLTAAYTFTPGSSTLNLSGIANFDVRNLFAVINLKTGALIYAPLAGYGYSVLSGTTLTLAASMAGMSASDALMVIYDDGGKPAEDASIQGVITAITALSTKMGGAPAQTADVAAIVAKLGTAPAQSSDMAAVVSRLGAAPAQTPDIAALGVILQSMLTTLQSQKTESVWTDDTEAFFVRVEVPGSSVPTWFTAAGVASNAPGTGARPAAGASITPLSDTFRALNTGTGYTQGDLLKHIELTNPSTSAVLGQFWINPTQNTKLTGAPLPADLQLIDPIAEGAATLAAQLAGNSSLASAVTTLSQILTAVSTQHADLTAIHTDTGTTLHTDLVSLLAKLGASPAQTADLQALGTKLGTAVAQTADITALGGKLGTAVAQSTDIATLTTAVNNVRAAVQAQIDLASTVWTDTAGNFYLLVQRVNEGTGVLTATIYDPVTSAVIGSTPTGFKPYGGSSGTGAVQKPPLQKVYKANASGTGYVAGDYLGSVTVIDDSAGSVALVTGAWINLTQHTVLSANPTAGTYDPEDQVVPTTIANALAATTTFQGAFGTTGPTLPAGASGLLGISHAMFLALQATQPRAIVSNAPSVFFSGTLASSGDAVALVVDGMNTIDVEAIGSASWAGTTVVEMQPKGSTQWYATMIGPFEGGPGVSALPTGVAAQLFTKHAGGIASFRVRATSAITNGPVTVNLSASNGIKGVRVDAPLTNPLNTQLVVAGAAAGPANPVPVAPGAGAVFPVSALPAAAAPTLTAGTAAPLSTDLAANLRTVAKQGAGNDAFATNQVVVTTSAAVLVPARAGRNGVMLINETANPARVGPSGVTLATGALLPGGIGSSLVIGTSAAIYGLGAVAGSVSVVEIF